MTTGYTVIIEEKEDLTLEEFALRFAGVETYADRRAVDRSYHQDNLRDLSKKLIDLSEMSHSDIEREAELKQWWWKKQYDEAMLKYKKLSVAYARMRAKVEAWDPPTRRLVDLKKRMLQQIDESAPSDPNEFYTENMRLEPKEAMVNFDHEAWRLSEYESVLSDMEYHQKTRAKVEESIVAQEIWEKQLRDSLKGHG